MSCHDREQLQEACAILKLVLGGQERCGCPHPTLLVPVATSHSVCLEGCVDNFRGHRGEGRGRAELWNQSLVGWKL